MDAKPSTLWGRLRKAGAIPTLMARSNPFTPTNQFDRCKHGRQHWGTPKMGGFVGSSPKKGTLQKPVRARTHCELGPMVQAWALIHLEILHK